MKRRRRHHPRRRNSTKAARSIPDWSRQIASAATIIERAYNDVETVFQEVNEVYRRTEDEAERNKLWRYMKDMEDGGIEEAAAAAGMLKKFAQTHRR